ncbi:hypothetical protein BJY59DRAFT_497156 [Rhodotorula toruloides]
MLSSCSHSDCSLAGGAIAQTTGDCGGFRARIFRAPALSCGLASMSSEGDWRRWRNEAGDGDTQQQQAARTRARGLRTWEGHSRARLPMPKLAVALPSPLAVASVFRSQLALRPARAAPAAVLELVTRLHTRSLNPAMLALTAAAATLALAGSSLATTTITAAPSPSQVQQAVKRAASQNPLTDYTYSYSAVPYQVLPGACVPLPFGILKAAPEEMLPC